MSALPKIAIFNYSIKRGYQIIMEISQQPSHLYTMQAPINLISNVKLIWDLYKSTKIQVFLVD